MSIDKPRPSKTFDSFFSFFTRSRFYISFARQPSLSQIITMNPNNAPQNDNGNFPMWYLLSGQYLKECAFSNPDREDDKELLIVNVFRPERVDAGYTPMIQYYYASKLQPADRFFKRAGIFLSSFFNLSRSEPNAFDQQNQRNRLHIGLAHFLHTNNQPIHGLAISYNIDRRAIHTHYPHSRFELSLNPQQLNVGSFDFEDQRLSDPDDAYQFLIDGVYEIFTRQPGAYNNLVGSNTADVLNFLEDRDVHSDDFFAPTGGQHRFLEITCTSRRMTINHTDYPEVNHIEDPYWEQGDDQQEEEEEEEQEEEEPMTEEERNRAGPSGAEWRQRREDMTAEVRERLSPDNPNFSQATSEDSFLDEEEAAQLEDSTLPDENVRQLSDEEFRDYLDRVRVGNYFLPVVAVPRRQIISSVSGRTINLRPHVAAFMHPRTRRYVVIDDSPPTLNPRRTRARMNPAQTLAEGRAIMQTLRQRNPPVAPPAVRRAAAGRRTAQPPPPPDKSTKRRR